MLPKTPLMVAPSDAINTLGCGLHHRDIIRGLRNVNPSLCIPEPSTWEGWYPGRAAGMTSIWWGQPPAAPKICAFHLGITPEFTQIGPEGNIIRRGWRDIFARVVKVRAATQEAIERQFKVSLATEGTDTRVCPKCRVDGKVIPATERDGLCTPHHTARMHAEASAARKREQRREAWLSP